MNSTWEMRFLHFCIGIFFSFALLTNSLNEYLQIIAFGNFVLVVFLYYYNTRSSYEGTALVGLVVTIFQLFIYLTTYSLYEGGMFASAIAAASVFFLIIFGIIGNIFWFTAGISIKRIFSQTKTKE